MASLPRVAISIPAALTLLLAVSAPAPSAAAADEPSNSSPGSAAVTKDPKDIPPGFDVEGGPLSEGEQLRRATALRDEEINAADPQFRHWVNLIRTGQADKRIMRLYWYYRSRLEPFDKLVPAGWRDSALAVLRDEARTKAALADFDAKRGELVLPPGGAIESTHAALRETSAGETASAVTAGTPGISPYGVWVPVGPFDIPGRISGLDRPAKEPNTLYAAAADGGIWRTRNAGATWEPLTDFEPTLSGGAVMLDPTDSRIIYFGTGEGTGAIDNYAGIGVLKSADGGNTWTRSNNFSSSVRGLATSKLNTNRIFAAGDLGCYVSSDAGASFSLITGNGMPGGTNGASGVAVRSDDPNYVYCALWGSPYGGIYRSTDGGSSWTLLSTGLPAQGSVGRIALAISKSNPDVLIAGIDVNNGRIYKTSNRGDSWNVATNGAGGYCGGQCWYDNTVGIDATNANILYAGGVSAYRSLDGGMSWSAMSSGVHVDHHAVFAPASGQVFLGNDGGIYRSTNTGASWTNIGFGMDTSQYYGICRHPSDPFFAMGGTQDNGSHRRRATDNPQWQQVLGADGGACMTGPPTGSVVLGEYQNHDMQRSTDGGNNFVPANGGVSGASSWVGLMTADPSNRNNMWTARQAIFRSKDARATRWVAVSGNLHTMGPPFNIPYSASSLEVSPVASTRVYAGFDNRGIYVTDNALDATVNWTPIHSTSQPLRSVRALTADATALDTLYAVFAGYGSGKIWKTSNKGASWTDVTGDLPDVPVNDLVADADNPGTLVISTDLGIFRSDNDGAHWYGWSIGYPSVASIEMTYDRTNDKLRVGTHGRSMWEWQEAATVPTAVPDGAAVAGVAMTVDKIGSSQMRLRWDVRSCTARNYNLFYGDLGQVATHSYSNAACGLGTSGLATISVPATPSGNVFFLIASTDGSGSEGPHDYSSPGVPVAASGIGFCGITNQVATATCQ